MRSCHEAQITLNPGQSAIRTKNAACASAARRIITALQAGTEDPTAVGTGPQQPTVSDPSPDTKPTESKRTGYERESGDAGIVAVQ